MCISLSPLSLSHTHTHKHARMHARMHARTHAEPVQKEDTVHKCSVPLRPQDNRLIIKTGFIQRMHKTNKTNCMSRLVLMLGLHCFWYFTLFLFFSLCLSLSLCVCVSLSLFLLFLIACFFLSFVGVVAQRDFQLVPDHCEKLAIKKPVKERGWWNGWGMGGGGGRRKTSADCRKTLVGSMALVVINPVPRAALHCA